MIALNLGVLVTLVLIHMAFSSVVGMLSVSAYLLFCGRIVMQAGEWVVLRAGLVPESDRLSHWYGAGSIVINVGFAGLISIVSQVEHSHYIVLMLIPIIAAAFRLSLAGLVLTIVGAAGLALLEVYLFFLRYPPAMMSEYFEAATVSLVYVIAGTAARLLSHELQRREERLRYALAELRAAQQTLVRSERLAAVGQLSGALAHEIRNPVAMIGASLRRAKNRDGNRDPSELIGIAEEEAGKLERITSDFLEYARDQRPDLRTYDLRDIAASVIDLAQASAEEVGVKIESDPAHDPAMVLCDPQRLHRAALNLVRNALEASAEGRTVRVSVASLDHRGILWIENDGPAIPDELVSRLFEPFVTNKQSGTGLGLSIARSIVRAQNGEVALGVNSDTLIRFEIQLPLANETKG